MTMQKQAIFRFKPFSNQQLKILTWWLPDSSVKDMDGIIADGAIRSGKTLSMSLSFVMWAMYSFRGQNLAMCGKTIGALRRNVITTLKLMLRARGYQVTDKRADNVLIIRRNGVENYFYLFGGRDESSQDLVQGVTLAGVFFDEVALMPESFVNQATGRCSVSGSKFWFNCNPANPLHWFKVNWIDAIEAEDEAKRKRLVYLHFTMEDNLSLTEEVKRRYRSMYVGVFYSRYIEGKWVSADGLIYDMFSKANIIKDSDVPVGMIHHPHTRRYVAIDYGTSNACAFLDIYDDGQRIWVLHEYYYSGREKGKQKTDSEYAEDLTGFANSEVLYYILDPSALSFKTELRKRGLRVKDADNEVLDGIRMTASLFASRKLLVHERCKRLIAELQGYIWDEKAALRGVEQPVKVNDHACDALRYFCKTMIHPRRL